MNKFLSQLVNSVTILTIFFVLQPIHASDIQPFDCEPTLLDNAEIQTSLLRIEGETLSKVAILCIESSLNNEPRFTLFKASKIVPMVRDKKLNSFLLYDNISNLGISSKPNESTSDTNQSSLSYKNKRLYDLIVKPFETELQDVDILMFAIDPHLPLFPPGVIYDGEKYLSEKYLISVIPNPTSILTLKDRLLSRNFFTQNQNILVMGTEQVPENSGFQQLLGLDDLISDFISQNDRKNRFTSLLESNFSIHNLSEQLEEESFGAVYIFTHASFNSDRPEESFIQLHDERLSLEKMANLLKDKNIDLLTLSTCQFLGRPESVEINFAKLADLMSVNTVLASQWDVEYLSTMVLMQEFHRSLTNQLEDYRLPGTNKTKQAFKAKALQEVQIAMLRNQIAIKNGEFVIRTESETEPRRIPIPKELAEDLNNQNRLLNHPYYWAAFTLVGSPW